MVFSEGWNAAFNGFCNAVEFSRKMSVGMLKEVGIIQSPQKVTVIPPDLENIQVSRLVYSGGPIIRIAAVSGALAVILGAYGAHTLPSKDLKDANAERENVFNTANRYHFFHTIALLGVPMCRLNKTAATFMTVGMVLFCGTCYYQAFTGDKSLSKLTPLGGTCFILGWLSMVF